MDDNVPPDKSHVNQQGCAAKLGARGSPWKLEAGGRSWGAAKSPFPGAGERGARGTGCLSGFDQA